MKIKVGINGFGRIGRNILRAGINDPNIDFVAINDLSDPAMLAYLLKYDSVYGVSPEEITHKKDSIKVGSRTIKVLSERDPGALPWKKLGVNIAVESTGFFTSADKAGKHLEAGAKKVIITAPAKGEDATVVMGVNEDKLKKSDKIISNASCTTNCLAPVAKVLLDNFGIKRGMMTTVHAYTNDQKILDMVHQDPRRARAAGMSIIPTTTGAAKAIGLVIPELKGKLDGLALRVPVPVGSIVDLVVELKKKADAKTVNAALKKAADKGRFKGILKYTEDPIVSADIVGSSYSSVVDGASTMVLDDNLVKVLAWYDNEWGFSNRVISLIKKVG